MKFKLLFCAGEQPRHGQSCITWVTSALWTVDMATTTVQTPRLTQQYQTTTMTSPPSPVNRIYVAIKLLADRLCPHGAVCFRLAVIFPGDFVSQFVPRGSASPGDLELENIFEDHEVSWLITDELIALELETLRRCFPAIAEIQQA